MAERRTASSGKPGSGKSGAGKPPGGRPTSNRAATNKSNTSTSAARSATNKPARSSAPESGAANRPPAGASRTSTAVRPPVKRKPGKSIVNQKQTPWGLIVATVAVVAFAVAIVVAVVATHKSTNSTTTASKGGQSVDKSDPYRQPELPAAKQIRGVTYRVEAQHDHVDGVIKYDTTPPVGGDHSQVWADCTGTVYAQPIANENAVHMLEHGAVWVTYNATTLPKAQVSALAKYVSGVGQMAMSPYPNLKSPISLQAWGYQLFVNSASDPRIAQFISTFRLNPKTTPETNTCSDPTFKAHPSTFGHPTDE